MTRGTYRKAKHWDACIQLTVPGLVTFWALVDFRPDLVGALFVGFYFGLGSAQFLSWLIWVIATPEATFRHGRRRYSIALIIILAVVGLGFLARIFLVFPLFLAPFVTPVMAVAYFVTTLNESKANDADEDQESPLSFSNP